MEQENYSLSLQPREVVLLLCALVLLSCYPDFQESDVTISALISELALQVYKNSIK